MASTNSFLHFDDSVEPADLLRGVQTIIQKVRPSWDLQNVEFKIFTAGISNQLMGCFPSNGDTAVLVRVYGAGTELFISREDEQKAMVNVAKAGLGPDLIATFQNGMVYHYVPGSTLTVESVAHPDIWPLVAARLGLMHKLSLMGGNPQLWLKMERFLSLFGDDFLSHSSFTSVKNALMNKSELVTEVSWLRSILYKSSNPIVFCHNDLLLANLIQCDDGSICFIDYEYAGDNYMAYDIANHFNEFAGVDDVDFSRIPSREFRRQWIKEYLKTLKNTDTVQEEDLTQVCREVDQFLAASHLHWALWSIVQAINSELDFDFANYASIRLDFYQRTKGLVSAPES